VRRQRRAVGRDGILVDVGGRNVRLLRAELVLLRDAGFRQAGRSSTARDLALLLDRALASPSALVLHGAEVRALTRLAGDAQLPELPSRLAAPTREAIRERELFRA
jgi:hypothetical protein